MYRLHADDCKKLKLTTAIKKLAENEIPTYRYPRDLYDETEDLKSLTATAKVLDKVYAFANYMMAQHGFIADMDAARTSWALDTYYNMDTETNGQTLINYRFMWSISFRYAATLFFKRMYKVPFRDRDFATISLLNHQNSFSNLGASPESTNWFEHRDAMMESLTSCPGEQNYLIAMALPNMDMQLIQDHRNIFNALRDKDAAALAAILK